MPADVVAGGVRTGTWRSAPESDAGDVEQLLRLGHRDLALLCREQVIRERRRGYGGDDVARDG